MSKRGNGEGSIYRRARDGRWVAAVTLPSGKRKTLTARTRREVIQRVNDLRGELAMGIAVLDRRQTVEQFLRHWLDSTARARVRPSTHESYEMHVRLYVVPHIGRMKVADVTGQHLQSLYGVLDTAGLSPGSIRKLHQILHSAFRQAVLWNLVGRNPSDAATPPARRPREMRTITATQVKRLIDHAPDQTFRALVALAATAGLRRGELLGLRWSDVDLDAKRLSVVRTAQRLKGSGVVLGDPKTRAGRRQVKISAFAATELVALKSEHAHLRELFGRDWNPNEHVFASIHGTILEEGRVWRVFKCMCDKAEITGLRFHDLRHSAATELMRANVNPRVVQEMLGHANVAITLDTYSHVTPDMQDAAAAAMDRAYRS